jgi:hypothetical protein
MASLTLASIPTRSETLLTPTDASGGTVLLNLDDGQYYALDDVGGRIWELSDGTRTVGQIAEALCAEYDAPLAEIQTDVLELLQDLVGEGLVSASG